MEKIPNSNQKKRATHFKLPLRKGVATVKPRVDPYSQHKQIMQHYKPNPLPQPKPITELEILKQNHQFIRHDSPQSWQERLATKYYSKLFREYCLGDFSHYKTGKLGLRWRTRDECVSGKGQFICGNIQCSALQKLKSWEVVFRYLEHGQVKKEMVKIRLCDECTDQMNYSRKRVATEEATRDESSRAKKVRAEKDQVAVEEEIARHADGEANEVDEEGQDEKIKESTIWDNPIELEKEISKEEDMDEFLNSLIL